MKILHRFQTASVLAGLVVLALTLSLHATTSRAANPSATSPVAGAASQPAGMSATATTSPSPDEQAVLAPINAMFAAMSKHDAAALKAPLLPGGTMVLMRNGTPHQMTFDAFADIIAKPGKAQIEERIHDPLVRVDNDLAVVWAPFDFLVDGKVDHCGTDLFNLVHTEGKWLIASVADTGRKECGK
jgi:hypothetical protein